MKRICAVLFAVAAALTTSLSGSAGAAVTALAPSPGDYGQTLVYDQGCTYQLTAQTAPETEGPVYFWDNGERIGRSFVDYQTGAATIDWTPTTVGVHEIVAWHAVPPGSTTIQVLVVPCPGPCGIPHL